MGEWMPADAHVAVPADADIDGWLRSGTDRYGSDLLVLTTATNLAGQLAQVVDAMLTTGRLGGFEWGWDPERRLLSNNLDLEVNHGLDDWFDDLAGALRAAG